MQYAEMEQTEGGFWPLVVVACVLLVGCNQTNTQVNTGNGSNSSGGTGTSVSADSTANGTKVTK
ncbi:MAG: hypothetical protein DDT42_01951 [candidate division WS2 bacterium]|uniref:Uncharacterized protein n=1 Tax=Psychracetigena formicireducens TaxID=2986056 RepID=A0A9E2BIB6_PSYF1|nr:hypothetical protein [Candidatus Psychracetigena formicireducens]